MVKLQNMKISKKLEDSPFGQFVGLYQRVIHKTMLPAWCEVTKTVPNRTIWGVPVLL